MKTRGLLFCLAVGLVFTTASLVAGSALAVITCIDCFEAQFPDGGGPIAVCIADMGEGGDCWEIGGAVNTCVVFSPGSCD